MPSLAMEDREEWCFLTIEDGQNNAAGPPQCTRFAESSTVHSRRLVTLRKKRSQCTVEAKRARREPEKVQIEESRRVFTSQV